MSYSIFDSDNVEDSQTTELVKNDKTPSTVTKEQAQLAQNIVTKYPTINASVLEGAVKLNISPDDPRLEQVVMRESIIKDEEGNGAIKSAGIFAKEKAKSGLKGLFLGFQGLWEEGAPRVVRYLEAKQQGMSDEEAREASKASLFGAAIEAKQAGKDIDLGEGLFLGSTDPTQTEEYKNLVASGVKPVDAREFVLDNILGAQIYEQQRLKAETGVQFVGERAEKFREAGLDPTVTIGRYLFKPFDEIVEPGTGAYNFITGAIDVVAQIFLDPAALATLGLSKVGKLKKAFTSTEEMRKFENSGLIGAARKTIHGPTTQQYLAGDAGLAFKKFLWDNADNQSVIITRSNEKINDAEFFTELRKFKKKNQKKTFDQIDKEMTKFVDEHLVKITNNNLPKINYKGNRMTKMLEKNYGPRINTQNVDDAMVQMNRLLRLATSEMDKDQAAKLTKTYMNKTLDALNSSDASTEVTKNLVTFFQKDFKPAVVKNLGGKIDKKGVVTGLSDSVTKLVDEGTSVMAQFYSEGGNYKSIGRKYATDSKGNELPITNLVRKILKKPIAGDATLVDPVVATQLANEIYLPNPAQLARAAKALDSRLGAAGTKFLAQQGPDTIRRAMDWYYGGFFKPLVLLRPAWTLRVIAEEQVRLLSSGVTNVVRHPIDFVARAINRPPDVQVGLINSFQNNAYHMQAMSDTVGTLSSIRRRYAGSGTWSTLNKGTNLTAWKEAAFRNVMQAYFDPMSKELAAIQRLQGSARNNAMRALKKKANTQGSQLNNHIRKITGAKDHMFHGAGKASAKGKALADEFINYVNANVAQVAGGVVETTTKAGATAASSRWIKETGKDELLEFISRKTGADGKPFADIDMSGLEKVDFKKYWQGQLEDIEYNKITEQLAKNQDAVKKDFFDKYLDLLPDTVKAELFDKSRSIQIFNNTIDKAYDFLMTVPTNKLSRSPAFKSFYWTKVAEAAQHATPATLKKIIKQADNIGLAKGSSVERKAYKKIKSYTGDKGGIKDIEIIDKIGASFALDKTKGLLYDVTTRTRLGQATRGLFPFGEAFVEIFTTWAKIIGQERGRPLRRAQQLVQAGRKPNPVFDDEAEKGFFYRDPLTNQELFGYPGEGLIKKWMFRDLEENGVKVNLPIYLQSINLAANVIPGFGPTITVPVAFLNSKFKLLKPEGVAQTIFFGDFAPPRAETPGEILNALVPFPSWSKKFFTAFAQNSDETKRMFNNTVIETYKALLFAGLASDASPEEAAKGLELAGDYARNIMLIRAASQFLGPSGIVTPKYEISDKNGNFFLFETLAEEWRNIEQNAPDIDTAFREFTSKYGFDPITLATAKTETIKKRPVTADGADWERKNKNLVEKFDLTYGYLIDETDAEFSYDAYWNQLVEGERVPRTPEQWQRAKNILKGNLEFEAWLIRNDLVNRTDKVATQAKRNKKAELASKYFGYGLSIPGSVKKPEIDEIIMELYTWFNPVTYDIIPELKNEPVAKALVEYVKERDKVIDVTTKMPGQNYLPTSFRSSAKLAPYRAHLRRVKSAILVKYPEAEALLDNVFERELREEYEDIELLKALNE